MNDAIIEPTLEHLEEVLRWLKEEEDATGSGFYCNRKVIARCFTEGRVRCILQDEKVIAFALHGVYGEESEIPIMEVHPKHRRSGHGRVLAEHTFRLLKALGANSVNVQCVPAASELFWRAQGFVEYIDEKNYQDPNDPTELQKSLV